MALRGKMAELLCKQDPARYEQHLQYDRRKIEHYMDVQLSKAVYGTVQAALRDLKISHTSDDTISQIIKNCQHVSETWLP